MRHDEIINLLLLNTKTDASNVHVSQAFLLMKVYKVIVVAMTSWIPFLCVAYL